MTLAIREDHNGGLVLHQSAQPPAAQKDMVAQLADWAHAAQAAHDMAVSLVETSFVPAQFRGKPHEATAAILSGAEMGLSPMASLRSFDIIQGTAAARAVTLRAVVQSRGHEMWEVETTDTRAIVRGHRKGSDKIRESKWTIDRARALGLTGKDNWKKQPGAMLLARATAECARLVASDAILGIPYSSEEIADGVYGEDAPDFTSPSDPVAAPRRTAKRRPLESALAAEPEPEAAPVRATVAAEPVSGVPVPDGGDKMNRAQQSRMHALFGKVDVTDRADRMSYVNEILAEKVGPGRQVSSSTELTGAEAGYVIDALQAWADQLESTDDEAGAS